MKQSEIKEGKMYSDGKTARVVLCIWLRTDYASSVDNFRDSRQCAVRAFARWAKYECEVVLEVEK